MPNPFNSRTSGNSEGDLGKLNIPPHKSNSAEPKWDRTQCAEDRVKSTDGYFKGRPIIGHDTRIAGGISIGGAGREAIVVDWRTSHRSPHNVTLHTLYDEAVRQATLGGTFKRGLALEAVYTTVGDHFSNCSEAALTNLLNAGNIQQDTKVHIQYFIDKRTGVCRHTSLTCAALLERMIDEGLLRGKVSNDRNKISGVGAHSWCRYTTSTGEVIILDVAQRFFGTLEKARHLGKWEYAHPSDRNTNDQGS